MRLPRFARNDTSFCRCEERLQIIGAETQELLLT